MYFQHHEWAWCYLSLYDAGLCLFFIGSRIRTMILYFNNSSSLVHRLSNKNFCFVCLSLSLRLMLIFLVSSGGFFLHFLAFNIFAGDNPCSLAVVPCSFLHFLRMFFYSFFSTSPLWLIDCGCSFEIYNPATLLDVQITYPVYEESQKEICPGPEHQLPTGSPLV